MRRVCCLLLFASLLMAACDKTEPPTPFQIGNHSITLVIPPDWEVINYGDKYQLRHDQERISLEDVGRWGRNLDVAIESAMILLEKDNRREEASRDTLEIPRRPAMVVDTWDHVSHEYRKRYLFALNKGRLLTVYTMSGQFEKMEPSFNEIAASIAFVDTVEQAGLGDGEDHPE